MFINGGTEASGLFEYRPNSHAVTLLIGDMKGEI